MVQTCLHISGANVEGNMFNASSISDTNYTMTISCIYDVKRTSSNANLWTSWLVVTGGWLGWCIVWLGNLEWLLWFGFTLGMNSFTTYMGMTIAHSGHFTILEYHTAFLVDSCEEDVHAKRWKIDGCLGCTDKVHIFIEREREDSFTVIPCNSSLLLGLSTQNYVSNKGSCRPLKYSHQHVHFFGWMNMMTWPWWRCHFNMLYK